MKPKSNLASFSQRALALFIDITLGSLPTSYALYLVSKNTTTLESLIPASFNTIAFILLPAVILLPIIQILLIKKTGASIGKLLVGIHIETQDHSPLTIGLIIIREMFAKTVSYMIFGAGYWIILYKPKESTFHDQLAGTKVTRTQGSLVPAIITLILLVSLCSWLFIQGIQNLSTNATLASELQYILEPLR